MFNRDFFENFSKNIGFDAAKSAALKKSIKLDFRKK